MASFTGPKSWLFAVACGFLQGVVAIIAFTVAIEELLSGRLLRSLLLVSVAVCLGITGIGHLYYLRTWYRLLQRKRQMPKAVRMTAKVLSRILDGIFYGI